MGTLCTSLNNRTIEQFFDDQFGFNNPDASEKKIAFAWKNFYAFHVIEYQQDGRTCRSVLVTKVSLHPRDYYDICYKAMDESVGPIAPAIPKRLLKLVEGWPPINEYARKYREQSKRFHEASSKIKPGFKMEYSARFSGYGRVEGEYEYLGGNCWRTPAGFNARLHRPAVIGHLLRKGE